MLPANLSRSAHYLNLQPQQPLLNPSSASSSAPPTNTLPSHSSPLFCHYCAPPPALPPCVSLTVSSSFEFPWADVSARVLTAFSTHNWVGCGPEWEVKRKGGCLSCGKAWGFGLVWAGKKDFRFLSLPPSLTLSFPLVWLRSVIFGA